VTADGGGRGTVRARLVGDEPAERSGDDAFQDVDEDDEHAPDLADRLHGVEPTGIAAADGADVDLAARREPRDQLGRRERADEVARDHCERCQRDVIHRGRAYGREHPGSAW
jgi:hypothetical protein